MQRIEQLADQVDFLLKVQEESLAACNRGFDELIKSLERVVATGSQESQDGAERVREFLTANMNELRDDIEAEIAGLREHYKMIKEAELLPVGRRKEEICELILSEAGELEDPLKFKLKVLQETASSRKEFLAMLEDIKAALDEGGVEELEALFEAMEYEAASEREKKSCCSDCTGCGGCDDDLEDVDSDELAEKFKKMSDPYILDKKKESKEFN